MLLPAIIFLSIFFIWSLEVLFPKKEEPKKPEQELADAIKKVMEKGGSPPNDGKSPKEKATK